MALITSYCDAMRIHEHQMVLITLECVPQDAISGSPAAMAGQLHAHVEAKVGFTTDNMRFFALRGTGLTWAKFEGNFSDGSVDLTKADISFAPAEVNGIAGCDAVVVVIKSSEIERMTLLPDSNENVLLWATALLKACGRAAELDGVTAASDLLRLASSKTGRKTLPLPCASTAFVAKVLPLPCVSTAFVA